MAACTGHMLTQTRSLRLTWQCIMSAGKSTCTLIVKVSGPFICVFCVWGLHSHRGAQHDGCLHELCNSCADGARMYSDLPAVGDSTVTGAPSTMAACTGHPHTQVLPPQTDMALQKTFADRSMCTLSDDQVIKFLIQSVKATRVWSLHSHRRAQHDGCLNQRQRLAQWPSPERSSQHLLTVLSALSVYGLSCEPQQPAGVYIDGACNSTAGQATAWSY